MEGLDRESWACDLASEQAQAWITTGKSQVPTWLHLNSAAGTRMAPPACRRGRRGASLSHIASELELKPRSRVSDTMQFEVWLEAREAQLKPKTH